MSSKLKLNSQAGGSVSLTVDDTLTTDEVVSAGNIPIDIGDGYIKYSDGTFIQYGSHTIGTISMIALGSMWKTDYITINFPEAFSSVPSCIVSFESPAGADTSFIGARTTGATTSTVKALAFNAASDAPHDTAAKISWQAIGRWK